MPKINWSKVKKLVPAPRGASKAELDQSQLGRLLGETHDATHFQRTGHAVNGEITNASSIRRKVVDRGTQSAAPQKTLSSEPVTNTAPPPKVTPEAPPAPTPVASESAKPLSKKEMRARLKEAKKTAKANKKAEPSIKEMGNKEWFNKLDAQGGVTPKQAKQLGFTRKEIRENLPNREFAANQKAIDQNLRENAHNAEQAKFRASREEKRAAKKASSSPKESITPIPKGTNSSEIWDETMRLTEGGTLEDLENTYRKLAGTNIYDPAKTPSTPKGGFKFKKSGVQRIKTDFSSPKNSVQSEIDAANPLGTQASREAEIAEAKARMVEQGEVTGSRKDGRGFFNSVKSSISNLKATAAEKINQATETVGGIKSSVTNKVGQAEEAIEGFKAKYSNTPTEFQKQTTEMVNKFSGGKYTGAVDTENMNWIEAGANKHLHKSVAQDYQNLMAKMQGAKDQEAFSKLMEETGINYKEGMSGADLEKNINAHFDKRIADGPDIANYMLGNRAASGAMLGVAGASVLALSDSRGRRSNSDLYSSQI